MISIIIPMYNRESLVGETLDSIKDQTYTDWECIVVDDGSTDNSVQVVKEYAEKDSRFRIMQRPGDRVKGPSACRNIGYEHSIGEYVYFFDSDDILSPEFLQTVEERMQEHPESEYAIMAYDGFIESPDKPVHYSKGYRSDKGSLYEQVMTDKITITTQAFFWKRTLLDRAPSLWRDDLSLFEDNELYKRLISDAGDGLWVDAPSLIHFRLGNADSLLGEGKKNPAVLTKAFIATRSESYLMCKILGRMTCRIHDGIMNEMLYQQFKYAVLFKNNESFYLFYDFMCRHSKSSFRDRFRHAFSMTIHLFRPILNFVGTAACRLPFLGRVLLRAKKK